MASNIDIMDKGMKCLLEQLGVVETEQFISSIIREKFDYTTWQRQRFDDMSLDEINEAAIDYEKDHPIDYKG